jgi:superfamily I DNA/RNA helicase
MSLQELEMQSKAPSPTKGAVPCLTIHASKGIEVGRVYLATNGRLSKFSAALTARHSIRCANQVFSQLSSRGQLVIWN